MDQSRRTFLATFATATAALASDRWLSFSAFDAPSLAPSNGPVKVLLDTDIGSDLDDAVALTYLLAQPRCQLLGITTVTGRPEQRAEIASMLCHAAGRPEIPILPGAAHPLLVPQRQSDVPQYAMLGRHPRATRFPAGQAVEFLRRTIRAHPGEIVLMAVGPLTNIAQLFRADPAIPRLLRGVVLMCGKFGPPSLRPGEAAEWNARIDPHAARLVFAHRPRVLRSYGLDVTTQVRMWPDEVERHFSRHRLLQPVLDLSPVWFQDGGRQLTFHDPLAVVSVFAPEVCALERGEVTVQVDPESPELGRTHWQEAPDGPHEVAVDVRPQRFFRSYFEPFSETAWS